MLVKDFMIKDVFLLKENETLKTLLEMMVEKRIGGMPITNESNQLVGIISDGDVLRTINPKLYSAYQFYYSEELDEKILGSADMMVKEIMHKKVFTLKEDDDLETALKLLAHHHFKKIPVINEKKEVVGIVSRGDMIRKLREKLLGSLNQ